VLSNLDNPLTILGYAAGFATGNVVGMLIEERLAIGHIHMSIISSARGVALAQALRDAVLLSLRCLHAARTAWCTC